MKAEEVAQYLQNHPQFFEDYADMLADIVIPHPYGGRTVSLPERQMLTLREKNRELEKRLHELIEYARDNEALQQKVHHFTLALFGARDMISLQEIVTRSLRDIFDVPHATLHAWKGLPPSAEVLSFADQQTTPACTHHALHDTLSWFGEAAPHLHSFAYLPLRNEEHSIGLLILASEDSQRFYPDMGTLFLQRIAETVSGALKPWL
ncbi:MAG: DUF484 family protein [Gallionellaceae bacterium]|jgi:uncharacterized protein YigA (DUF484 family)|nr:DUF484 family protein [Gallionellaceae bacterium]